MTLRQDDEHLDSYEQWARDRLEPVFGPLRVTDRKGGPPASMTWKRTCLQGLRLPITRIEPDQVLCAFPWVTLGAPFVIPVLTRMSYGRIRQRGPVGETKTQIRRLCLRISDLGTRQIACHVGSHRFVRVVSVVVQRCKGKAGHHYCGGARPGYRIRPRWCRCVLVPAKSRRLARSHWS